MNRAADRDGIAMPASTEEWRAVLDAAGLSHVEASFLVVDPTASRDRVGDASATFTALDTDPTYQGEVPGFTRTRTAVSKE